MPIAVTIDDLGDNGGEAGRDRALAALVMPLDAPVDLVRRLEDEEQAAGEQDQVAPREGVLEQREDRRREPDQERQHHQQQDAED
jgi:hypothetical protein